MTGQQTEGVSTSGQDQRGGHAIAPSIAELRVEHVREALGVGAASPRLSWRVHTGASGWSQQAYELEARRADGSVFGNTGRVDSPESVLVAWPFVALASRERVDVRDRK